MVLLWLFGLLLPIATMVFLEGVIIDYTLQFHGYVYYASPLFNNIWIQSQCAFNMLSFLGYFIIALALVIQKKVYQSVYKLSRMEFLLMIQGFLMTVPITIVNHVGLYGNMKIMAGQEIYLFWGVLAALVPVIDLIVQIGFNP
ncbi:hypothetical protein L596_029308 [Steinernema carpocapsae]|uniref:Uncharacterized protein n=1 Tax=Steinernema carpocapsae TaxID=34508 RepID=A0A4U5LU94_STECR|nr:hypothetical protein L596_029308 [Steinernema carpocapsae]